MIERIRSLSVGAWLVGGMALLIGGLVVAQGGLQLFRHCVTGPPSVVDATRVEPNWGGPRVEPFVGSTVTGSTADGPPSSIGLRLQGRAPEGWLWLQPPLRDPATEELQAELRLTLSPQP